MSLQVESVFLQMHTLTTSEAKHLMLYMEAYDGECVYLTYAGFSIQDAVDHFSVHRDLTPLYTPATITDDSFVTTKRAAFSTYDQDNDNNPTQNCGLNRSCGWWFKNCAQGNFNGLYEDADCDKCGIFYRGFRGDDETLQRVAMKLRDASYTM